MLFPKRGNQSPVESTKIHDLVAKVFIILEKSNPDWKSDLHGLSITRAREIDCHFGRAIVIQVPPRLITSYRKVLSKLTHELEKKLSGKNVIIVGDHRARFDL